MYHEQIAQLRARIVEVERPDKVILFGSYASGTATESSDIDLLVISRSTLPRREREVRLTRQLFGSGVPYDLLVLTPEEIEERLRRNGPFIRDSVDWSGCLSAPMTPDYDVATFETWRLKAEEDFTAASILAEHAGPAATICFLCQQVAEKYLKGYLLLRRQPPKRIHHLDVLLEDC